ncbi:Nif3-like dinuclear metal center hexameric protein [Fluviicola sp.]|jgi:dinuclear metal center YbgI/SA1388 family protein|uniref:Nif3-like dinuclear metal center hexameric protein n=1 Tax=Fluviicola sp. TaxID=1917219 RepID=UPI0028191E09|nr:Nif3-like dinuclear metal center hexameric protein [Fluviicola sp.]MDR0802720.1 Nif3-like dinuclear metal center hexameric protein [Fluviicola sp.]
MQVKELVSFLNHLAPFTYQEVYDNSGLLVGNPAAEITGVVVALDCLESVVDEAILHSANVVLTHHPIIFKGLKRITGVNYVERTVLKAINHGINLVAVHTNLDNVHFGVNYIIAEKLGLKDLKILSPKAATAYKLAVFVPQTHADLLREAMAEAGAGHIGAYNSCSFSSKGEGRFRPDENAAPFIGKAGEPEVVKEMKVEVVISEHAVQAVLHAMKATHPYEEIAYDLIALTNTNEYIGSGMTGTLEEGMEAMEFLRLVKRTFHCGAIRYTHPAKSMVKRIAVCGGSGSFLLKDAIRANVDVFITGDFKYHEFFDAEDHLMIADIGHFESEQYTSEWLVAQLKKKFTKFAVRLTNVNTNPINYL